MEHDAIKVMLVCGNIDHDYKCQEYILVMETSNNFETITYVRQACSHTLHDCCVQNSLCTENKKNFWVSIWPSSQAVKG